MPTFKCLYYFYSTELSVIEIKRTDLPEGAPLSDIYKWLVLPSKSEEVIELHFKSMDKTETDEYRGFVEGEFRFNSVEGHLNLEGTSYRLEQKNPEEVPVDCLEFIRNLLDK